MISSMALALLAVVASADVPAGAGAEAHRVEELRKALLDHDREALVQDPKLVAGKYARMSKDRYAFLRGTAWLYAARPSAFLAPAASKIALMGDPHLENVGTFTTGAGVQVVDFNDFDMARYGAYVDDLRRLALALWIAADMGDLGRKHRARVIEELVDGYVTEVQNLLANRTPFTLRTNDNAFNGDMQAVLVAPEDEEAADRTPARPDEVKLVRDLLARYPASLHDPKRVPAAFFKVKKVQRAPAGISSYPLLRFRVTIEGKTASPKDDRILDVKESRGALPAAKIVQLQRQFQEFPDDDPLLGWAAAGAQEFRIREVSAEQRRIDAYRLIKELKSPRWKKRDMREFAVALGRLLARGHGKSPDADGKPGLAGLKEALSGKKGLDEEIIAVVEAQAAAQKAAYHDFRDLLRARGPLLGWKP
jgi:hypothetical protein